MLIHICTPPHMTTGSGMGASYTSCSQLSVKSCLQSYPTLAFLLIQLMGTRGQSSRGPRAEDGAPVGRMSSINNINCPSSASCWRKLQILKGDSGSSMTPQKKVLYVHTHIHTTCSHFHILTHILTYTDITQEHAYLYIHGQRHMHTQTYSCLHMLTSTLAYNTYVYTLTSIYKFSYSDVYIHS